jgi:alanine dehydrogenase
MNATLSYVLALAGKGVRQAMEDDRYLRDGRNVHDGKVTYQAVAEALGYCYVPPMQALAGVVRLAVIDGRDTAPQRPLLTRR